MDPSRFDRLSRTLAAATTRRATLVALFGGLLSFDVSDEKTDAKGRGRKQRRQRGGGRDAQDEQDRGRHQRNGRDQADKQKKRKKQKQQEREKKKKQEKKSRQRCPDGQSRCGANCVDVGSDAGNCGRCGAACAAGQRCQDGACTCNGEQCAGCCDGAACQDGRGDDQCGENGATCVPCTGGRTCQRGTCACPAGQDICNDACVDQQMDLDHCGECGRACGSGEICQGGACGVLCPTGGSSICVAGSATPDCCAGECTATATDPDNCGECGAACGGVANGKARCTGGRCGIENCDPGFANCSGSDATGCETNTRSDRAHCGGCNNECPPGQECRGGGCTCGADGACGAGETCCDGVCRNLETSFEACGRCAAACDDRQADQCRGGVCTCGNGAACPDGRTCQGGSCSCPAGQDICGDGCVDRQTDASHCGQCGHECAQDEICLAGLCGVTCGASDFCS